MKNILFGILMCTAYLAYSQNSTPVSVILKKDTTGIITKNHTRAYGNNSISYKSIYGEKEITSDMTVDNQPLDFSYIKFTNNYSTRMVLSCIQ